MLAVGWQKEPLHAEGGRPPEQSARASGLWNEMISEADKIGLPTRFLRRMDPDFVEIEFEDLRSIAAEYHPAHHRKSSNSISPPISGWPLAQTCTASSSSLRPALR